MSIKVDIEVEKLINDYQFLNLYFETRYEYINQRTSITKIFFKNDIIFEERLSNWHKNIEKDKYISVVKEYILSTPKILKAIERYIVNKNKFLTLISDKEKEIKEKFEEVFCDFDSDYDYSSSITIDFIQFRDWNNNTYRDIFSTSPINTNYISDIYEIYILSSNYDKIEINNISDELIDKINSKLNIYYVFLEKLLFFTRVIKVNTLLSNYRRDSFNKVDFKYYETKFYSFDKDIDFSNARKYDSGFIGID